MEKGYVMEDNKFIDYGVGYSEGLYSAFVKINYTFRWRFVFLQTGLATGSGNYSTLRFKHQLGLMYNF